MGFTIEAIFLHNGFLNWQNFVYFASTLDRKYKWWLNVSGKIRGNQLIGPDVFGGILNGRDWNFLRNEFVNDLEEALLNVRANMWLQQDGCHTDYGI